VTIQTTRREELGLTQTAAAARAGLSVQTWQQWEEDPSAVSAEAAEQCEHVIDVEEARTDLAQRAAGFAEAWADCSYLTPRQAGALATRLASWSDNIAEWLEAPFEQPLHEVGPFESIDRRVMIYVDENRAWAAKAQERCDAMSEEVESGVLPFDRDGCFFDELLVGAALPEARAIYTALPDMFADIPARAVARDDGADGATVTDDDWDGAGEAFDDLCRWETSQVPLYTDHPLLAGLIADMHPYTWFDPPETYDAEYDEESEETASPDD
jgi:transcriptional regulator with XRE-family HTH domain